MSKEIWKDVVGYEGLYQVSNLGNIKDFNNNKLLPFGAGWKGQYLGLRLKNNTSNKKWYVHRIVCFAFLGSPINNKYQVNHIDGNKHNNKLDNLEWVTPKENQHHRYSVLNQSQSGEKNPTNKYPESLIKQVIHLYKTTDLKQREIAKLTGIDYRYVNLIVHNKAWKHLER